MSQSHLMKNIITESLLIFFLKNNWVGKFVSWQSLLQTDLWLFWRLCCNCLFHSHIRMIIIFCKAKLSTCSFVVSLTIPSIVSKSWNNAGPLMWWYYSLRKKHSGFLGWTLPVHLPFWFHFHLVTFSLYSPFTFYRLAVGVVFLNFRVQDYFGKVIILIQF